MRVKALGSIFSTTHIQMASMESQVLLNKSFWIFNSLFPGAILLAWNNSVCVCCACLCICAFSTNKYLMTVYKDYFRKNLLLCVLVFMCTICVPGSHRGQKRAWDTLKQKLPVIVSHLLWVLGTKPDPIQVMYDEFLTTEVSCPHLNLLIHSIN